VTFVTETTTSPSAIRTTPRPTLRGTLTALFQADVVVQLRNGRALLLTFLLPLVLLFALSAGKRGVVLGDPAFRVALAIMVGIVSQALLGYALTVALDRDKGVFQRLRVTPAPTWAIMASRLTVQVMGILVMTVVVLVAAAVVQGVSLSPAAYGLTFVVVIVSAFVFLSIGQALVGLVRSADTVNAAGRLLFPPLLVLGLLSQTDILGTTIESIAQWSPGGVVVALLSGAMQPATWSATTWWALLASVAYSIVLAGVGIRWFQWSTH
jgi:ABC-2 type transport system permease protein